MQLVCLAISVKSQKKKKKKSHLLNTTTRFPFPLHQTQKGRILFHQQSSNIQALFCFGFILTGKSQIAIGPREAAWSVKGSQAGIHFKHFSQLRDIISTVHSWIFHHKCNPRGSFPVFVRPSTARNGAGSQATVRHRVSQEEGKGQKSQIWFDLIFLIDYGSPCCAGAI